MPSQVRGAVFCGGVSRRMGTDKARLVVPGSQETLLERAVGVLDAVCGRVVLACGSEPRYGELGRDPVLDAVPGAGPLAGLSAALDELEADGDGWLCALACDMPGASAEIFEALLERARSNALDVCLLSGPDGVEPLCGVYRARCAAPVRRALAAGRRRLIAFHGDGVAVGTLDVSELALGDACTTNVNTPADYERERKSRSGGKHP